MVSCSVSVMDEVWFDVGPECVVVGVQVIPMVVLCMVGGE